MSIGRGLPRETCRPVREPRARVCLVAWTELGLAAQPLGKCHSHVVSGLDIGAVGQQQDGNCEVVIAHRNRQRCPAVLRATSTGDRASSSNAISMAVEQCLCCPSLPIRRSCIRNAPASSRAKLLPLGTAPSAGPRRAPRHAVRLPAHIVRVVDTAALGKHTFHPGQISFARSFRNEHPVGQLDDRPLTSHRELSSRAKTCKKPVCCNCAEYMNCDKYFRHGAAVHAIFAHTLTMASAASELSPSAGGRDGPSPAGKGGAAPEGYKGFGSFHTEVSVADMLATPRAAWTRPAVPFDEAAIIASACSRVREAAMVERSLAAEAAPQSAGTADAEARLQALARGDGSGDADSDSGAGASGSLPLGRALVTGRAFHVEPDWCFVNHGAFGGALVPGVDAAQQWQRAAEAQPLRFIDRELFPHVVHSIRTMAECMAHSETAQVPTARRDEAGETPATGASAVAAAAAAVGDDPSSGNGGSVEASTTTPATTGAGAAAAMPTLSTAEMDPSDVVLLPNATTGLNVAIAAAPLGPSRPAFTLSICYGALKKMLDFACARAGATAIVHDTPFPPPAEACSSAEAFADWVVGLYEEHLPTGAGLAVVDAVTSNTALVLPVARIAAVCRRKGVPLLVDGAHAMGSVGGCGPESGATWFVTNCHKWWSSPRGLAAMWVHPEAQATTRPLVVSHGYGSGFASEFVWDGCRDYSAALSVPAVAAFRAAMGERRVARYCRDLLAIAVDLLVGAWGTGTPVPIGCHSHMALVRVPDGAVHPSGRDGKATSAHAKHLQDSLHEGCKVECPVKCLGGQLFVRISAAVYNCPADYSRLAEAVLACAADMA